METIELRVGDAVHPTRIAGRPGDPLVLCLHGFPDLPDTFDGLLPALAAAGFRAAAPTMRGYAPSCQPADGDYTIATIAGDVVGLLDALGASRAHVFGHDWGAVVTYAAGARAPDRFASLATLAVPPPHRIRGALGRVPGQVLKSWYQLFFQVPGLSDRAVERRDWALVRWLCARWSPGFAFDETRWAARRAAFGAPGVRQAMLSWYRQNLSPLDLIRGRGLFAPMAVPVPTLAMSGARDGCMDTRLYDHGLPAEDFPAGVRVERLEGVGHFAHLEAPAAVEGLLLGWLAEHRDRAT